jgi:hypothetical protein
VTLRITLAPTEGRRTALRLEGRFTGADLPVLDSCVAGRDPEAIELDLSELRWLDPVAAERLGRLVASGARLIAISPFVERLLARPAPDSPPGPAPAQPPDR